MKLLLFFLVLIIIPNYGFADNYNGKLEIFTERLTALEQQFSNEPFSYDIKLRADIKQALTQQAEFNRRLPILEKQILELDRLVHSEKKPCCATPSESDFEKPLNNLRSEFLLLFQTNNDTNKQTINALEKFNISAVNSATAAATEANNRLENFLTSLTIITTLGTILATIYVYISQRKIRGVEETARSAKEYQSEAEKLYTSLKELEGIIKKDIKKEKEEVNKIKLEVSSLHQMIDLRENYNKLRSDSFSPTSSINRVIQQAEKLLADLRDIARYEDSKDNDENLANLSYVNAVLGVLHFKLENYEKAYKCFKLAEKSNVHKKPDRITNYACAAAKLFSESEFKEQKYLNEVLNCFLKLTDSKSELEKLENEQEIKDIWNYIQAELRD